MRPTTLLARSRSRLFNAMPRWVRRSMRVRVVALTLVLGAFVVLGVGAFVLNDVASGLAKDKTADAFTESAGAIQEFQTALNSSDVSDQPKLENRLDGLISRIEGYPGPPVREAVLLRAEGNTNPIVVPPRRSGTLVDNPVSPQLRAAVTAEPGILQAQPTSLQLTSADQARVPAVVVGSAVELPLAGRYELYLVYRMDDQVRSLRLMERAFVVGGIALVAMVGTITWLVTRLVVIPVREAARTAERLAAGELDRRMAVHGEDEVARLAGSFNIMAASLQAQITRLESLSRLQQRFVSDVSHELRTPLTTIRMAADVLSDRMHPEAGLDPDLLRSVALLGTQIDRFEVLLADLLEVSRFDAGAAVLDVELVDLLGIVEECAEMMRPVAEQYRVSIDIVPTDAGAIDGGAGQPAGGERRDVRAEADHRRLSRIVRNLLSNAIEHSEGRDIVVTLAGDADSVAIGVRDYGVGMSSDHLERVFDRFWRGDPSRRRTLGGSGLGLAISMEDARLHGGRLEVWSRVGEGAHFVVTLPRRVRSGLGTGPIAATPDTATVNGVTVEPVFETREPVTAATEPTAGRAGPDPVPGPVPAQVRR